MGNYLYTATSEEPEEEPPKVLTIEEELSILQKERELSDNVIINDTSKTYATAVNTLSVDEIIERIDSKITEFRIRKKQELKKIRKQEKEKEKYKVSNMIKVLEKKFVARTSLRPTKKPINRRARRKHKKFIPTVRTPPLYEE